MPGAHRPAIALRSTIAAYVVLVVALGLTALAWYARIQTVEARSQARFDLAVNEITRRIQRRLATYVDVLYGVRALHRTSESVERDEFRTYFDVINLWERYPGIHGIGFARHVPARDLARFMDRVRRDTSLHPAGYPQFAVRPEGQREEYVVIEYVEPFERNREVFGFDMASDPVRRAALFEARDNGKPAASGAIRLGSRIEAAQTMFLIAMPVYRNGAHVGEVDDRRRAIIGYLVARFNVKELLNGILTDIQKEGIDFEIFEAPSLEPGALLHDEDDVRRAVADPRDGLTRLVNIPVSGRKWSIFYAPRDGFRQQFEEDAVWLVPATGGVLSLLLFGIAWMQARTIQERRTQADALSHQAAHDSLTGLPNRRLLYKCAESALEAARPTGAPIALLLIDLDGFKEINDTLGHQSGDDLLCQLGPRLRAVVGPKDVVARLGGDEFAVLLHAPQSQGEAEYIARRLRTSLAAPFDLHGLKVQIGAGIGIALHPVHGADISTLMRCADVAMYAAKRNTGGVTLYDAGLDPYSPQRLTLMSELGQAIADDQLVLHYQPIVRLDDGAVVGVEALVRWQHPRHGLVPPDQFISQAERSDLIHPLMYWVADNALAQCRRWRDAGFDLHVAINLSARNLQDAELPERLKTLLARHGIAPSRLELELTESAIIVHREWSENMLIRLAEMGIVTTIDDYGTGYSSLAYLRRLPVRRLKIDRSFVTDMERNDNDAVIVHSTINLAHNLGMQVVAEGVEDPEILVILKILGCDHAQGYYVGRPVPAAEIDEWLARRRQEGFAGLSAARDN